MTYYETLMVQDYSDQVTFNNCAKSGVPCLLLKIGKRCLFTGMLDLEAGAQVILPNECKPKSVSVGGCVCTGNVVFQPTQQYFMLMNADRNLYFSAFTPARIMFCATWDVNP